MLNVVPWAFLAILYSPVFYKLYRSRWETIDYTHAYFILPVSLWLVWRKRAEIARAYAAAKPNAAANPAKIFNFDIAIRSYQSPQMRKAQSPESTSVLLILFGLFLYIFGWRQDFLFLSTFSLIPVLFGATAFLYGPQVTRTVRFPIFYLLLLVPPPLGVLDAITLPMRYGVSWVAYIILRSFDLPFTRDGLLLSVQGQELFMGPACSGFRSLITMFSLGLAYAYVSKSSRKTKIWLVASVIPLALFGNLIRVLMLCFMAYFFGNEMAQGFFHDFSGFLVFVIIVLGMLLIESLLNRHEKEENAE